MSDTLRTDEQKFGASCAEDFCRKLERELTQQAAQFHKEIAQRQDVVRANRKLDLEERDQLRADLAAALIENAEQARLLGMSAERECALRGRVERLERELAAVQGEYESRAAWIAKMLPILGCENKDGFNCKDAHATASALIAELAALREDKAILIAALEDIGAYTGEGGPNTPWRNIVRDCGATARAAIDAAMKEDAK